MNRFARWQARLRISLCAPLAMASYRLPSRSRPVVQRLVGLGRVELPTRSLGDFYPLSNPTARLYYISLIFNVLLTAYTYSNCSCTGTVVK